MTRTGHVDPKLPVVNWQGENTKPYRALRLEEMQGRTPADGHDPGVPHRIGFHAMMLVTQGSFDHWLDFRTHRFSKNQLLYIAPNQVHHFVRSNRQYNVSALIFRPEVFPEGLLRVGVGPAPWSIMCYLWPSVTTLTSQQAQLLDQQMELLRRLESIESGNYFTAANHHVCGIIALAFEFARANQVESKELFSCDRFHEFVQLVEQSFDSRRDVKWYAERLDCSQRTLNRICQKMNGETAKAFLSQRVIIEAKRMLIHGMDSVNDMSFRLGFAATTNFVRYFKNETGMTPMEFRKEHGAV